MTADLLARLETATGVDWELDALVHEAVTTFDARRAGPGWPDESALVVPAFPGWRPLPAYTASIDAALSLVSEKLPGWGSRVVLDESGQHAQAVLWRSHLTNETVVAEHSTRPLAILIALLKCLRALETTHE